MIYLREKDGTGRWQPISRSLMTALLDHGEARGAAGESGGQMLRYRNGNPITHRRYDNLRVRLGRYLPWITTLTVSAHRIRHTTLTWVKRNVGFAIAHAYAGHFDEADTKNATMTYVKAAVHDVATALSSLTGEPHPLADPELVLVPVPGGGRYQNQPTLTCSVPCATPCRSMPQPNHCPTTDDTGSRESHPPDQEDSGFELTANV